MGPTQLWWNDVSNYRCHQNMGPPNWIEKQVRYVQPHDPITVVSNSSTMHICLNPYFNGHWMFYCVWPFQVHIIQQLYDSFCFPFSATKVIDPDWRRVFRARVFNNGLVQWSPCGAFVGYQNTQHKCHWLEACTTILIIQCTHCWLKFVGDVFGLTCRSSYVRGRH